MRKNYILDSNILIHDPNSIFQFADNTVIIPVGVITTVPAQALSGALPAGAVGLAALIALVLLVGASLVFRTGLRRYGSASS